MQCVLDKIFANVLSTISQKKIKKFKFSAVHKSSKIAYTKMYKTQKLIN